MTRVIQSILFDKKLWTVKKAIKYIDEKNTKDGSGFKKSKLDETSKYYRFRQVKPDNTKKYYIEKSNRSGLKFVVMY